MSILQKADILRGLEQLDRKAKEAGVVVDISVYGGAALILAFDLERATRDVDVVVKDNLPLVRELIAEIAEENDWPESWLNDGVKGFVASNEAMRLFSDATDEKGGVRIYTPSVEYLFAMKCMAMRLEGDAHDLSDIEFLADVAGIKDADSALDIVASFYPSARIPARVTFGVREIMERMAENAGNLKHIESAKMVETEQQPAR
ncbi:MAG: nucleotidyltransferase [Candidatus Accumulibacter sp.]|jgi:hypothetical protein|nr:nucleotidyltransferase [Accumulibacter sp.]